MLFMKLGRKIVSSLLLVTMILVAGDVNAQCLNDAWSISNAPYSLNDVVSNDGSDWICIDAGQGHWEPSGGAGHFGWNLQSATCASYTKPVVADTEFSGLYCRTVVGNGDVTDNGGASITSRGMVYSTSTGPTLADNVVEHDYNAEGEYVCLIDNLSPETIYYISSYATNSEGTTYGLETSFETDADVDCADCNLACDKSDATLLNPTTWPGVITSDDTLCVTEDFTMNDIITCQGTIKICNDAQVTLTGSITMEGFDPSVSAEGQIIYEGCNEKFIGTGSYTGYRTADNSENDERQMISYCSTCDNSDRSQFLDVRLTIAWWGAGCRPESSFLPVELIAFTTEKQNEGAILNWTTASEISNSHFEVQTSIDGINWITIGIVQGAGDSFEENNYSFYDNEPGSGVQYYRLKQVDFDGTATNSNVNKVSFDEDSEPSYILAYDNGNNEIEVKLAVNGMGSVNLVDGRGRIVQKQTFISISKKGTIIKFDKSNLPQGIYFINMVSNNIYMSQKISIFK